MTKELINGINKNAYQMSQKIWLVAETLLEMVDTLTDNLDEISTDISIDLMKKCEELKSLAIKYHPENLEKYGKE